jgi:hypothetical protein
VLSRNRHCHYVAGKHSDLLCGVSLVHLHGCLVSIPHLPFLFVTWLEQFPVPLDWKCRLASIVIFVDVQFDHRESFKVCQALVAEQTPVRRLSLADVHMQHLELP